MAEPVPGSRPERLLLRFPLLSAALAGVAVALAFPPWHILPGLLGLAVLTLLIIRSPGAGVAFGRGLVFGIALSLVTTSWVAIAFSAEADKFGALALPATFLLCLAIALFPACYAAFLKAWHIDHPVAASLGLAALWGLGEWVRASILEFPWNPMAVVWTASEATLQFVALTGTAALSMLTVFAAALAVLLITDTRRWAQVAATATPLLLVAVIYGYGSWRFTYAVPPPTDLYLRVVQANIPQDAKWDPERLRTNFLSQVELSHEPAPTAPRITVWPESAVPFSLEQDATVRGYIGQIARAGQGYVVTGSNHIVRTDDGGYVANNSIYVIGPDGEIETRYDKANLVPFGEFLPFRPVMNAIGLHAVAASMGDFTPGPGRTTVELPGIPAFSPTICYEAAYPSDATDGTGRAEWLLNVTNDAWFGDSAGPRQHLALAEMRSVEEGLPLVRAANTGISVVTDAYGRVVGELGIDESGVIDGYLPAALPERPAGGRYGHVLGWLMLALLVVACSMTQFGPGRNQDARGSMGNLGRGPDERRT